MGRWRVKGDNREKKKRKEENRSKYREERIGWRGKRRENHTAKEMTIQRILLLHFDTTKR
jgi:hypothetical protein